MDKGAGQATVHGVTKSSDVATKQQHLGRKHRKGEFLSISLTSLNDVYYVSHTQKVVIYFGLQDSGQIWKISDL